MPGCSVAACHNWNGVTKNKNVKYFQFPKDEAIRQKWVDACSSDKKINVQNGRICSLHFTSDCFLDTSHLSIPGEKPVLKLLSNAMPSINLTTDSNSSFSGLLSSCAVRSCTSNARIDKKNSTGITFHSFPRDRKRRNIWIKFLKNGKWVPSTTSKLCSKHFLEEHINRTSLYSVRLTHNAIPTINGPQNLQLKSTVKQEQDNHFIEEQKLEIEEHFLSNTIKEENDQICKEMKTEFVSIKEENDTS